MDNLALIDADSLIWSESYNQTSTNTIAERLDMKLGVILSNTECNHYKLFVGGYNNFRYHIRTDYKANRINAEKPELFNWTKQYIIDSLNAFVSNGLETDDTVCATAKYVTDKKLFHPIVCTIDKDYKIKPLDIYIYERHMKGKVFPAKRFTVSKNDAFKNMLLMLLTGDRGDNILTCKGIGVKTAEKLLSGLSHYGMVKSVVMTYKSHYGSRWRYKLNEVYNLINLIDDYDRVFIPKEFDFVL